MSKKYTVEIGDKVVTWEDGKYDSDDKELLRHIRNAEFKARGNPYFQVSLDGNILYSGDWIRPSKHWATSFGFLQDITDGNIKFISGDRPTWNKLGNEEKEDTVY